MVDMSHWDFADEFSAKEAASLILGVDPKIDGEAIRAKPIFDKLRSSYQSAWGYWHTRCDGEFEFNEEVTLPDTAIQSVEMLHYVGMFVQPGLTEERKESFCRWLGWKTSEDGVGSGFGHSTYSRQELNRWLRALGLKSAYQFVTSEAVHQIATDVPLGKRERDTLLTIIAALCKEAGININTPSKAGDLIQSLTDDLGAPVAKRTIEEHLKKIPDALATRMK
jgi:hypothetical protein